MEMNLSGHSADADIDAFFVKTSATRAACDARARELLCGNILPAEVQGPDTYSVYDFPGLERVVHFCRAHSALKVSFLVREVYGSLAPAVAFEGQIGEDDKDKEPLYVCVMDRVGGLTHLDPIVVHGFPENSSKNMPWIRDLAVDEVAHSMAQTWKQARPMSPEHRSTVKTSYLRSLCRLHATLPSRFLSHVQACLDSLDYIVSLPEVTVYHDPNFCSVTVTPPMCLDHIVGEADVARRPFGLTLYNLQSLTRTLHLRRGWNFADYHALTDLFWERFQKKAGGLSDEVLRVIKLARVLGLLLRFGFSTHAAAAGVTERGPDPLPIGDEEEDRFKMMSLDGYLLNVQAQFDDFEGGE